MTSNTINNQRIARNMMFMYFRMILLTIISLYTSRVLLQKLGVEDFGLYNVVGGIVAMLSSLKGLFTSSIQRFLNMAKRSDGQLQSRVFCMGVTIHILIAIVFVLLAEAIGFFLLGRLTIDSNRIVSAQIVFQLSIAASVASILTVPYDALIIAYEKMNVYAYISLLDALLRLSVIFLLDFVPFDRLISYAFLIVVVSIGIRSVSAIYCKNVMPVSKYTMIWDRGLFLEMSRFAGWNFAGNMAYSLTHEGINFILNMFGGVVVNAARTIAYQIRSALYMFIENILISFRPQAMVAYGDNNCQRFFHIMHFSSRVLFFIASLLGSLIFVYSHTILTLWLGDIPQYTEEMVASILLYTLIRSVHNPIDMLFKSSGRLKTYQLTEMAVMLLNLPIAWIVLYCGFPYYSVILSMSALELINLGLILLIARRQEHYPLTTYFHEVIIPIVMYLFCCTTLIFSAYKTSETSFLKQMVSAFLLVSTLTLAAWFVLFKSTERKEIQRLVNCKYSNKR